MHAALSRIAHCQFFTLRHEDAEAKLRRKILQFEEKLRFNIFLVRLWMNQGRRQKNFPGGGGGGYKNRSSINY